MVLFSEVKQILDEAIDGWKARTGREPHLDVHGTNFSWDSHTQLLNSDAFGHKLIQPDLIGVNRGHETNLVIAVRDPAGVDSLGQMPSGGPFLSAGKIDRIIQWINEGALADEDVEARLQTSPETQATARMDMFDPEVNKQSDLNPYPDGPAKLLNSWDVTVGFDSQTPSPIYIRVTGVAGGSGGIRPGSVFDDIQADNVFQETSFVYHGSDTQGCIVLQNAAIGPTQSPPYDPTANHFPDPNETYPFRNIPANGRWFTVMWQIAVDGGRPKLSVTARQMPRVNSVQDRVCPTM